MKKFLCVLLSLGMLLTAANVCAAPGDVVNVALDKPAFANQQYGALSPKTPQTETRRPAMLAHGARQAPT